MTNNFVQLHNHSEYSYLDGHGSAADYISRAKKLGMSAIAITDHGGVDGCLKWQQECDKQKMGCILGCEAYIVPDQNIKKKETRGHIVILVHNLQGWQQLCKLLTQANLSGFYHKPRIDFNSLLNADLSGFVILTACVASFINLPGGIDVLLELQKRMPGRLFLEAQPHDFDEQYIYNSKLFKLHDAYQIPMVISNDCHYVNEEDWEAQEVLLAIGTKAKWTDKKRFKFSIKGLYLRSKREMQLAFRKHCFSTDQINEAIDNTSKVAEICKSFRIPKQEISLPSPHNNQNDNKVLDRLCLTKIKKEKLSSVYLERYKREFKLIKQKDFSRYFLIFHDLMRWCSKNNIPVGPGRGSAGGSLIAYLIGITKVDPIFFNLSFSRFISEDRIDYPDIDCDFAKRNREEVREYLVDKYGENYTCGISTFMKLKTKAAVQAVSRVFEVPSKDINAFSKSIYQVGKEKALQSAVDNTKEGQYFNEKYPDVIKFALKMENQVRGTGQHAAALVVSNEDLTQGTKCVLIRRHKRIVCNWSMQDSEDCGLMKLDILGLSTLSVLDEAVRLVNEI